MSTSDKVIRTTDPKDLLGDPLPATPAMNAPLPWRVYRMNDTDWYTARSIDEAMTEYVRQCGGPIEETCEGVRELTDEEMDRLHYVDTDENDRSVKGSRRTFRAELAQRIAAGVSKPELFASTEY